MFCYRLDSDRLLVGGALTDGGSLLDWFKDFVGENRYYKALNDIENFYQTATTDSFMQPKRESALISCLKSGDSSASSSTSIFDKNAVGSIGTKFNTIRSRITNIYQYIKNGKTFTAFIFIFKDSDFNVDEIDFPFFIY